MNKHLLIFSVATILLAVGSPVGAADAKIPGVEAQPASYFYTGKPYDNDLGDYNFRFRNYDPQSNRWTSADPSGFPDGANNRSYAPVPTSDLDYEGLRKWSTLKDMGMRGPSQQDGNSIVFDLWTIQTNDGASTIQLYKYVSGAPAGSDYTFNCAGYVFGNSHYWIQGTFIPAMLAGDGYKQIKGSNYTGAKIADWGTAHVAWVHPTLDPKGNVTEVTGKKGATVGTTTSTPQRQWSGPVTYWE